MGMNFLAAAPAVMGQLATQRHDIISLVLDAGLVVKAVLILLLGLSVISWTIIGAKLWILKKAKHNSIKFAELFWSSDNMDTIFGATEKMKPNPISEVFRAGYVELIKIKNTSKKENNAQGVSTAKIKLGTIKNIERSLTREITSETTSLERYVSFLATTGSTAPFIGLFGTVWGIMNSFINIGAKGATNIAVVAPGISEALIATAIGLFAAIPAVVFYNLFVNKIKVITREMDNFASDFLNIIKRDFYRG
jgi:biopolymer transport protein TolQ